MLPAKARIQEERRLRFGTVFEGAPIGMALVGLDGRWLDVNRALCRLVDYSEEELLGKTVQEITHPEDLAAGVAALEQLIAGEITTYETEKRYVRRGGEVVWILLTASLARDEAGAPQYLVALMQDVTDIREQKRAERALKRSQEELERALSEREAYARELEQSNQELQEFAYIASHDLQEPLRKVQAFADRLSTRYADELDDTGQDYLDRMRAAAKRMQSLIQSLLTYSRVTSKGQPFERVDLEKVGREVALDLSLQIERAGASLVIEELPEIEADPLQMRQLFQNLLSNALKFRRPDVSPEVRFSGASLGNDEVELRVTDNGVGVEMRYAEQIFRPFERLHRRSEYEGTGIGLAICRKIVERHEGQISVESEQGAGTRFIIRLPRHQDEGRTRA